MSRTANENLFENHDPRAATINGYDAKLLHSRASRIRRRHQHGRADDRHQLFRQRHIGQPDASGAMGVATLAEVKGHRAYAGTRIGAGENLEITPLPATTAAMQALRSATPTNPPTRWLQQVLFGPK